ncbi:type II toxin-antitoxin system HicB family antitoxin [Acaryochloris thomasi]|uniref:type II toxin-antitoxin system HicB family antitoxin n=1 Tax=Acaryochloris thomasi TaxID=2929456 RepID=UPI0011B5727C|nr:type II toxin-antitoxin system HicB family antitoxin [Acaryochloris thomasi]
MKINAVIHPAEESGVWAKVPALPGCITEGDTMEEVQANLKDGSLKKICGEDVSA